MVVMSQDYFEYVSGERARKILMSTKDMVFKNRKSILLDWAGNVLATQGMDDDYVPCRNCKINMYPENCFGVEFASEKTDWTWCLYEVYCEDCSKEYWEDLPQKSYLKTSPLI